MSKFFPFLIAIFLISCNSERELKKENNDLIFNNLKGRVKKIKVSVENGYAEGNGMSDLLYHYTTSWFLNKEPMELIAGRQMLKYPSEHSEYEFTSAGNFSEIRILREGRVAVKEIYAYTNNIITSIKKYQGEWQNLDEEINYMYSDNKLSSRTTTGGNRDYVYHWKFDYNDNSVNTRRILYRDTNEQSVAGTLKYAYNEKGDIRSVVFTESDTRDIIIEFAYDASNRITSVKENEKVICFVEYNKHGDIVKLTDSTRNHVVVSAEYVYDKNGDWAKQVQKRINFNDTAKVSSDKSREVIIRREIEYY